MTSTTLERRKKKTTAATSNVQGLKGLNRVRRVGLVLLGYLLLVGVWSFSAERQSTWTECGKQDGVAGHARCDERFNVGAHGRERSLSTDPGALRVSCADSQKQAIRVSARDAVVGVDKDVGVGVPDVHYTGSDNQGGRRIQYPLDRIKIAIGRAPNPESAEAHHLQFHSKTLVDPALVAPDPKGSQARCPVGGLVIKRILHRYHSIVRRDWPLPPTKWRPSSAFQYAVSSTCAGWKSRTPPVAFAPSS